MQCCTYFFPEQPAQADHPSAIKLRKIITFAVVIHMIFAILTVIFVGFTTMLAQFMYIVILYSYYMTLRECTLFVYGALLVCNLFMGVISIFFSEDWGEFIVYLILLAFYTVMVLILNQKQGFVKEINIPASHFAPGISHMIGTARGQNRELLNPQ